VAINALLAAGLMALVTMLAMACGEDEPHITYIGIVDASPPRVGRPDAGSPD
jgi:hypothetical protein